MRVVECKFCGFNRWNMPGPCESCGAAEPVIPPPTEEAK